jgi:hypothetical protein
MTDTVSFTKAQYAAFEPETVQSMSLAFGEACRALGVGDGNQHDREVIAARIVELARDASRLRDRLLHEVTLRIG